MEELEKSSHALTTQDMKFTHPYQIISKEDCGQYYKEKKKWYYGDFPCSYPYTRYKFYIQVSNQENLDQENLNSSLCIHDARNFDEYTQVLAEDTTNKMAFLGGEEGAALCIALLCTIVLRRRLNSKKRSTWARKWHRRQRWDVFL